MTRDQALLIARRIMDRCEIDRAMHLDAIADEVMAGAALQSAPPTIGAMEPTDVAAYCRLIDFGAISAAPKSYEVNEAEIMDLLTRGMAVRRISLDDFNT